MLAFSAPAPLGRLRSSCNPATTRVRYRLQAVTSRNGRRLPPSSLAAVSAEEKLEPGSLTSRFLSDLNIGHLWDALDHLEAALPDMVDHSTPLIPNRLFHELIYQCAQRRNWQVALRGFHVMERSGAYSVRSTTTHLFSALSRAGRITETYEVLQELWRPYIVLQDGTQRQLSDRDQARRVPDERMITQIANSVLRVGRPDAAVKVIKDMEGNGVPASIFTISVLINALGRQDNADAVKTVLAGLEGRGMKPDVIVINTAIEAFIRCGERSKAGQLLRRMGTYGLTPTVRSFNPVFRDLAKNVKIAEMEALQQEMVRLEIAPTSRTYNAFIHAHVKAQNWTKAAQLLVESAALGAESAQDPNRFRDEDSVGNSRGKGRGPVAMTQGVAVGYTTVISGLAASRDMKRAASLLEKMVSVIESTGKTRELEIEIGIAVAAILSALLAQDDVVRTWKLFRSIRKRFKVRLPPDTYNAVIRGLAKRGESVSMEAATQVFNEMMIVFKKERSENRYRPSRKADAPIDGAREATSEDISLAYNSLIDGYVRCGNSTAGEQLLDELEDSAHMPTVVTYTTLMSGYGKELDIISTRRIFRRMQKAGIGPDRVTMNAFIGACVRVGDMELAVRLFEQMQRRSGRISPNLVTFSAIIAGYVRQNHITQAWDTYEEMKGLGIVPNERLLERMMAAVVAPELKPGREEMWDLQDELDEDEGIPILIEDGENVKLKERRIQQRLGEHGRSETSEIEEMKFGGEECGSRILSAVERELKMIEEEGSSVTNDMSGIGVREGWSSKRAMTLLEDMENCKCSDVNKARWRKAIEKVWTF